MSGLSRIFTNTNYTSVPRHELAEIVKPFTLARLWKQPGEITPRDIADGWREMEDWLRIGFAGETEGHKGTAYEALYRSMRFIAGAARATPDHEQSIRLRKIDLQVLRANYFQLVSAADYLQMAEAHKKANPDFSFIPNNAPLPPDSVDFKTHIQVEDKNGKKSYHRLVGDMRGVTPFYNRPNENYVLRANDLRKSYQSLNTFFTTHTVKPAPSNRQDEYIRAYNFD